MIKNDTSKAGEEKVNDLYDKIMDQALEDVMKELATPNDKDSDDEEHQRKVGGLAGYVKTCFEESENGRALIEDRWMDALRQYKGIYPPEVMTKIGPNRSHLFVPVTRTKVRTIDSRLLDLLFPADGEKNWSINPTPIPQYSDKFLEGVIQLYAQDTGEEITRNELDVLILQQAKSQAAKMSNTISDQLVEAHYNDHMNNVVHDGNLYGTGVIKGPLVAITENRQYYRKTDKDGKYKWLLQEYDSITPFVEHVPVWDIYPDMDATTLNDARYIIQRRKMSKHELVDLTKRSDFDASVINTYLKTYPDGDYISKGYESVLNNIGDVNVATNFTAKDKRYEVLEFWGYVDADDLECLDVDIPEDKRGAFQLSANIWVLGNKIIKATLSPVDGIKWPYFFYYYEKDETSIFGIGIPDIMKSVQELTNSAWRALLDNMAISSGPQVEVNTNLVAIDENTQEIYPWKIWYRTSEYADAGVPAVRFHTIPSNTNEIMNLINLSGNLMDEVTAIHKYMWGEPSGNAARTASGLSMLMGSANIVLKNQVRNFDEGITKPFITAMYYWNMQFNDDESIKGDYATDARGSTSLIAKEVRSERLISFAQITSNPAFAEFVKNQDLVTEIANSLDLHNDNLVLSDEEVAARQEAAAREAEAEREFVNSIIEAAREQGISPTAMMDAMRLLRREMQIPLAGEDISGAEGTQQQALMMSQAQQMAEQPQQQQQVQEPSEVAI